MRYIGQELRLVTVGCPELVDRIGELGGTRRHLLLKTLVLVGELAGHDIHVIGQGDDLRGHARPASKHVRGGQLPFGDGPRDILKIGNGACDHGSELASQKGRAYEERGRDENKQDVVAGGQTGDHENGRAYANVADHSAGIIGYWAGNDDAFATVHHGYLPAPDASLVDDVHEVAPLGGSRRIREAIGGYV